jgi:outer membrane lipase/esterase
MMSRRHWHISALAAAALIVAGCGGGDTNSPLATRVVIFGDSLSDVGTYAVATSINGPGTGAPFFGGKFTTNAHTGYTATSNTSTSNTWGEWIAARFAVPMTPAEVGFATTRIPCPAVASGLPNSCTGYAQGGSRVTDPIGIGKTSGFLTIPIVAQIASHNTRTVTGFRTGFDSSDVVFVWGGHNDAFTQLGAVAAGAITPVAAVAAMQTAGTELANLVKNEIIAKGATRVAVLNAVDISVTPGYSGLAAPNKALLTQLTAEFNTALLAGLAGSSAQLIDVRSYLNSVVANPSLAGMTNVTQPVCGTPAWNTSGSSLACNAAPAALFAASGVPNFNSLVPGTNASTYLFADGVHPTTGGHRATADFVWGKVKEFGWAPANL